MNKSYDSIIGNLIWTLGELREFVEENVPSKVIQVEMIQEALEKLDYYMAYGEEPTQGIDLTQINPMDLAFTVEELEALKKI